MPHLWPPHKALVEAVNSPYKGEVIHNANVYPDAWQGITDIEKATLEWVGWHNTERIHSKLGNRSPNDFEALYWDNLDTTATSAA